MTTLLDLFELYKEALRGESNFYWENEIIDFLIEKHKLLEKTTDQKLKEMLIQEIEFAHEIRDSILKIEGGEKYV